MCVHAYFVWLMCLLFISQYGSSTCCVLSVWLMFILYVCTSQLNPVCEGNSVFYLLYQSDFCPWVHKMCSGGSRLGRSGGLVSDIDVPVLVLYVTCACGFSRC